MGDRSWVEGRVLLKDAEKLSEHLFGATPLKDFTETYEEKDGCVFFFEYEVSGGGYDGFEAAAKDGIVFVASSGACPGAYGALVYASDGSGVLATCAAEDGTGLMVVDIDPLTGMPDPAGMADAVQYIEIERRARQKLNQRDEEVHHPKFDVTENYIGRCAWNDDTFTKLYESFIGECGLDAVLNDWMQRKAFDELLECGELDEDDE